MAIQVKRIENKADEAEIIAYGIIGDKVDIDAFSSELNALGNVPKISVRIFSEGGSFFTGLAIHDILKKHPSQKTAYIDGLCASAATFLAMGCDKVVMPKNSWMMIHAPEKLTYGNAAQLREDADMLDRYNNSLVSIYSAFTKKTQADISAMLTKDTWMNADDAKKNGFITDISEDMKIAACVDSESKIFARAPDAVKAIFLKAKPAEPVVAPVVVPVAPPALDVAALTAQIEANLTKAIEAKFEALKPKAPPAISEEEADERKKIHNEILQLTRAIQAKKARAS